MKSGLEGHGETFQPSLEIEDTLGMSQINGIVSANRLFLGSIWQFPAGQGIVSASGLSASPGAVHCDRHDTVWRPGFESHLHRPDRGVPLLTILCVRPDTVTHRLALILELLGGQQFLNRPLDLFTRPWSVLFHLKWIQS